MTNQRNGKMPEVATIINQKPGGPAGVQVVLESAATVPGEATSRGPLETPRQALARWAAQVKPLHVEGAP